MSSSPFKFIPKVFGPADCFPRDHLGQTAHQIRVGGLPSSLVPCPRCFRSLFQVALLPLSLTCHFGGREPWPILFCPSEDNNQLLSYTVHDGRITLVDFFQGALVDSGFERVVPLGQNEELIELYEVTLRRPELFCDLHLRAQEPLTGADLFALDEALTQAWLDEYCESPALVEMGQWPAMLLGGLPFGALRLAPGLCPLTGAPMTAVGIIANPAGGLTWSPIFLDTLRISFCQESSLITVTGGFNQDLVWSQ